MKTTVSRPPLKLLMVGADVEMFLRNLKTGAPVPCVGIVGGTKDHPLPLPGMEPGFARQEDNVLLEFNVPPAITADEFSSNFQRALSSISTLLSPKGLEFLITPSMRFSPDLLTSKQAMTFGCEPDFNVWERRVNDSPAECPETKTLRTAGGHIHISFLIEDKIPKFPEDIEVIESVIMALDIFLGLPFTSIDQDTDRRKMYGKAGAFRVKPYGIEYRTLSNVWITSQARTSFVFSQVEQAFKYMNSQFHALNSHLRQYEPYVTNGINNNQHMHRARLMEALSVKAIS